MKGTNPERGPLEIKDKDMSHYFQAIARQFLSHRGAPFFLSSKDLVLVETWEKLGIPLSVVLEGIERSFENLRQKPAKKARVLSLSFCNLQVLRAFGQYRERLIGRSKKVESREAKRRKIKAEVEKFLGHLPEELFYLKETFVKAQKIVSRREVEEKELEQMEEKIEEALLCHSPEGEKEEIKKEILAEYKFEDKEEFQKAFETRLIKFLRDKYRIPYISFYYY